MTILIGRMLVADEAETIAAGDHTQAEALRLAKGHLEKLGWKYTAADIGKTAQKILDGLYARSTTNGD